MKASLKLSILLIVIFISGCQKNEKHDSIRMPLYQECIEKVLLFKVELTLLLPEW